MNKQIISIVVLVAVLVIGGYFLRDTETDAPGEVVYQTYSDPALELQFDYKIEPDGYVVEDLTAFVSMRPEGTELLKVLRIINAREKLELESSEGGREGPPVITVMIFKNLQNQSASQWTDTFSMFSNIGLVLGEVDRDAVVGGANAVRYRTDGLYQNENVVVAHGGFIYYFNGAFLEEGSTIHRDFSDLVDSIEFIPGI